MINNSKKGVCMESSINYNNVGENMVFYLRFGIVQTI